MNILMQDKGVILDEQEYEIPDRSVNLRKSWRKKKRKSRNITNLTTRKY